MIAAGVVAALAAEARALGSVQNETTLVTVSGMGCEAAERASTLLIGRGAAALVSWGMAGALDPMLEAGAVCLPSVVIDPDGICFLTAPAWRESLAARIATRRPIHRGKLLTSVKVIDSVEAKAAAHRASGAAAVDMESSAVARVAAAHGLPFIAVRVIVDTACDSVPGAVMSASRTSGQVRLGRLIAALIRAPGEIVPLLRLGRRYRAALNSLALVASLGGLAPPGAAGAPAPGAADERPA